MIRNIIMTIVAILGIVSIIGIIYSIAAGIWFFNPTDISYFNFKLFLTSIILFIVVSVAFKLDEEF